MERRRISRHKIPLCVAYMVCNGLAALPAPAKVVYVKQDATGQGDGSSWADALVDLQSALTTASRGDTVWVAASVYTPAGPGGDRAATFQLRSDVALLGGFAGDETELGQRQPAIHETILSGDLNQNDIFVPSPADLLSHPSRADNSIHVVTATGTEPTAVLDGFTIRGGNADTFDPPNDPHGQGAGIRNERGNPTISNCVFRSNAAISGSAMANLLGASPTLSNCTMQENAGVALWNVFSSSPILMRCRFEANVGDVGGAMYNRDDSDVTLIDCEFVENVARIGGAVFNEACRPTLARCIFIRNTAMDGGGMANIAGARPTLLDNTFIENTAQNNGGGLYNVSGFADDGSQPALAACTFVSNTAGVRGGAIYSAEGSAPTLSGCTVRANRAGLDGGGVFTMDGRTLVTESLIAGNAPGGLDAWEGATLLAVNCAIVGNAFDGVFATNQSTATLMNCTIVGNSLNGVAVLNDSTATITNSILWGNVSDGDMGESVQVFVDPLSASTIEVSFSVIQNLDMLSGDGNIGGDPRFVRSPDPGADGLIATEDDDFGDVRLGPRSSAIDAGNSDARLPGTDASRPTRGGGQRLPPIDLDGNARRVDDPCTDDGGKRPLPIVDMGAFEFVPVASDFDCDGDVDLSDFLAFSQCFTGPAITASPDCRSADLDRDNDVDLSDLVAFQSALTGSRSAR